MNNTVVLMLSVVWVCAWTIMGHFAPATTASEGMRVGGLMLLSIVILLWTFGGDA